MMSMVLMVLCAPSAWASGPDDLRMRIIPLPASSRPSLEDMRSRPHILVEPDGFVWCPSVLQGDDGTYHMFYSRWPRAIGFDAWLTHSEIVHAVADRPEGPYRMRAVALTPAGPDRGDWFTAHNPKIKKFEGRYYLYFIQTRGDSFRGEGERKRVEMARAGGHHPLWRTEARPNQRVFVASSDSLDGPWTVSSEPIVEPSRSITTLAVNPAICRGPEGSYFMIVKGDRPGGTGQRNQAIATAPRPEGPWKIRDQPVIGDLDTEDISMWYDSVRQRFYAVFHAHAFIGMMTSTDGLAWEKAAQYRLTPRVIPFDDGTSWTPDRMERPFVLTDGRGTPRMLYVACKKGRMTANIALALAVDAPLGNQGPVPPWGSDAGLFPAHPQGASNPGASPGSIRE